MTYLPLVGGAEIAVKEITDRLVDFEFDLVAARLDKKISSFERIGRINIYRVGRGCVLDKYLFPFLAYFRAKELHQKNNYQIVQAIMAFYAGLAALFFKWRFRRVKYLLTMQSGDSDLFIWLRTWFWRPIYKKIYTEPDYIQAISRFLFKRARKYGYRGEGEIVPNGVDIKKFSPGFNQLALKKKLGIKQGEKIIVTVSRLVKKNGVDDLIKAGQYLNFPFKILIAGCGPDEKKLKRLAKELNLGDKVLFLGLIGHNNLREYISLGHVFVRPSLSEGLGNVFLEAMATGVPVIGTRVGGIPDFLKDGETGLFCQVRNPRSIAGKIKEILRNQSLRKTLAKNGLALIRSGYYDWKSIALKMNKIYQRINQ